MNRAAERRGERRNRRRGTALDYAVGAAGIVWAYQTIMGVAG